MNQEEKNKQKSKIKLDLSQRLLCAASLVSYGNIAADIGCDHGYVPIWLVSQSISPAAIAADVRSGPLERANAHIKDYGLSDKIETRLGDGLSRIKPKEVQSIIMTGIGGPLMIKILEEGEKTAKSADELILSPQSDLESVRRYLYENSYAIQHEIMLKEEGKYYNIFYVRPHKDESIWSAEEFLYGKNYEQSSKETVCEFVTKEIKKQTQILNGLLKTEQTERIVQRENELKQAIDMAWKFLKDKGEC